MNNTARAILLVLKCCGSMTAKEISERSGINLRVVQRALKDIRLSNDASVANDTYVATHTSQNDTYVAPLACAHDAHKLPLENIKNPIPKNSRDHGANPRALGTNPRAKAARKLADMNGFDDWYALYPKKTGKAAAEKAWPKAVRRAGSPETIIENLKLHLPAMRAKERQFIKDPATWLNAACWEDEVEAPQRQRRQPKTQLEILMEGYAQSGRA